MSRPKPHWYVVWAGNVLVAQGYCYCDEPDADRHVIAEREDNA